ncbi:hypothetical protein [Curvibacter lanceolatus]|uniref:hypothetical protein n=1 Tax=Curvibacter lanceolatus TaxID=86182 RepID=UPI0012FC7C9D|nr:hypothetical protein [Curvibacter lanceolatus]
MTMHAMLILYAAIGLLVSIVGIVLEANNHINEWKHSSIDLPDDLKEKPGKLLFLKILNKVVSLVFQVVLYTIFWPVVLVLYIASKMRSAKQEKEYQDTTFLED